MLERDRTYNDILDRVERLEMRIEDLRDVARPAEVVIVEEPNWQAVAGWVSTGTVLQDVNGRIVLDPTIPRILIDADGYIESADFVAGTSGFRIDGGTAEFNDIVIRGTIYASVGIIGGWTITATQLKAAGDVIILDSAGIITVGGVGYLQSNPFTSGAVGWRITPTEAEFGNIVARGELRTAVFKYNEVHAQAGQLLVTPNAAKLDADMTVSAGTGTLYAEAGRFSASDIVRLKDGTGDVWLVIVADVGDGSYTYQRSAGSPVGTVFRAGTGLVGYGVSGEGGIVLDAVTANGPFIDIFTHAGSPWTMLTTKVRVGNLAGIVDADLSPSGHGLYTDNIFLKGKVWANSGRINGVLDIGTAGGFYQGTGTFAVPTTGLKIWNDGGIGRLATYNTGVVQVYFGTDGKFCGGAGAVVVDADGMSTSGLGGAGTPRQIRFKDTTPGAGSPYVLGRVYGDWGGGGGDKACTFLIAQRLAGNPWPVGATAIMMAYDTVIGVDIRLECHAEAAPYGACTGGGFRVEQGLRVGTTGAGADDNDLQVDGAGTFGEGITLTGAGASYGILCGADVQWYRSAADLWRTPDSVTVDVGLNVGSATSAATGEIRLSADARVGAGLWVGSTASDPDDNDVHFDGNLKSVKAASTYDVYALVPLQTMLGSTSWDGDAKGAASSGAIEVDTVFGCPLSVTAVCVRVAIKDDTAGIHMYVGPQLNQYAMAATTFVVNQYIHGTGIVATKIVGGHPTIYVSFSGDLGEVFMYVTGYFI